MKKPELTAAEREEHKPLTSAELEGWLSSDRRMLENPNWSGDDIDVSKNNMRLYATIEKDRKKIEELEAKLKKTSGSYESALSRCQADGENDPGWLDYLAQRDADRR